MRANERADTKIEVDEVMNKERETKDEWEEPVDSGQEIDVLRSDTERGRMEREKKNKQNRQGDRKETRKERILRRGRREEESQQMSQNHSSSSKTLHLHNPQEENYEGVLDISTHRKPKNPNVLTTRANRTRHGFIY